MEYSYKFRLYPNSEQEDQILRTSGCCRYVWTHYLAKRKEVYELNSKTLNYYGYVRDIFITRGVKPLALTMGI